MKHPRPDPMSSAGSGRGCAKLPSPLLPFPTLSTLTTLSSFNTSNTLQIVPTVPTAPCTSQKCRKRQPKWTRVVGTWSHRSRQSGCEGGTTSSGQTPSVGHAKPCLQRRKWARSLPLDRTSLPQIRTKGQQLLFIFVFYYIPYSDTMIIGRKKSLVPWRINFEKRERLCGKKCIKLQSSKVIE
jgi:hypothetical protein